MTNSLDKTGGPAFPQNYTPVNIPTSSYGGCYSYSTPYGYGCVAAGHSGMTLRDYFAAAALPAIINGDFIKYHDQSAKIAYAIADAMIAARATGEA